jgi:hypothetical protein
MSRWYEITFTHHSNILTDSFGLQLLHDFGYSDNIKFEKAFLEDDQVISHLFREVIHSESGQEEILYLSDEKATGFMDVLHKVACLICELNDNLTYLCSQCIMASDDTLFVLPARQLLTDLCAATKAFPPTLFLELDSVDTNRQIGRGGFADIFLGRYQGQDVALKRLQLYQPEPNEMSKISKVCLIPFHYFQSQFNESTEPVAGGSRLGPPQTSLRFTIFWSRQAIL